MKDLNANLWSWRREETYVVIKNEALELETTLERCCQIGDNEKRI